MADGRFLSRSIGQNEQLARVSLEAALLFSWCVPHLDVEGRMTGNVELVKASICPLRPEISVSRIPALLRQLVREGLVTWYELGGRRYLAFPGFSRQQKGLRKEKEAASRIPAPNAKGVQMLDGADPDQLSLVARSRPTPSTDALGPPEVEVEGEVEVQAEVEAAAARPGRDATPDYATACCITVNQGLERLLAGAYRPLVASVEAPIAASWAAAGIPVDVAQAVLAERTAAFRSRPMNRQPNTLKYFDAAVREAWAVRAARAAGPAVLTPAERMRAAAVRLEQESA